MESKEQKIDDVIRDLGFESKEPPKPRLTKEELNAAGSKALRKLMHLTGQIKEDENEKI